MGFGAALAGGALGGAVSAGLQEDAQEFIKKAYKNRYQWTMQDLERAGLNPILAAKGGLTGSSPTSPLAGAPKFDLATARLQGAQVSTERQKKATLSSQGTKFEADARNANSAADLAEAQKAATVLNNEKTAMVLDEFRKNPALIREEIGAQIAPKTITDAVMRLLTGSVGVSGPVEHGSESMRRLRGFVNEAQKARNRSGASDVPLPKRQGAYFRHGINRAKQERFKKEQKRR